MQVTAAMVKELRERTGAGMMECKKALVACDGDIDVAIEQMRKSGQAKADKKAGRVAAEGLVSVQVSGDGHAGALVEVNCETDFVAKEDDFRGFAQAVAARALAEGVDDVGAIAELTLEPGGGQSIEERRRDLVARIGENIALRRAALVHSPGGCVGAYVHGGRIGVLVDLSGGDAAVAKDVAMHVAAIGPMAVSADDLPGDALEREKEILRAQVADSGKPPEIQEKMVSGRVSKYLKEVTLLGQPFVKDTDKSVEKYLAESGASVGSFTRYEVGEGIEKKTENFAEEVKAQLRGSDGS